MANKSKRWSHLFLGLFMDAMGMLSVAFPGIGDFLDIFWAPIAGWVMSYMYKGRTGKIAGVITFLEEIIPGPIDFIPTFTLMWIYTYLLRKK